MLVWERAHLEVNGCIKDYSFDINHSTFIRVLQEKAHCVRQPRRFLVAAESKINTLFMKSSVDAHLSGDQKMFNV